MRKYINAFLGLLLALPVFAQHMTVKRHNYTKFSTDIKKITPVLEKRSTAEDKQHPEYGILPFNAYCSHCAELIDKRTVDSRYFVDVDTQAKFFIEKSYFPLHYKQTADDVWRTIDYRLKPGSQPGIYEATNQPVPTQCDLNRKSTSFLLGKQAFEFNHNLTLYFFDEEKAYIKPEQGDYTNYTIGDEGMYVKNIWQGIDMEQTFRAGEIETNYVINAPLHLPIEGGYMVIEDHFTLPDGWTVKEAANGNKPANGYFSGDYKIGDGKGTEIVYHRPAYFDAKAIGMMGLYNLIKSGNDYTLQMMVPVKWLNMPGNTYPLNIDPIVAPDSSIAETIIGNYESSGNPPFQYAFTDMHLGSCNDTMGVPTPPGTTVGEAYVALEYQLTYNPTCGSPAELAPYCTFSQVRQQIINNNCQTSGGFLGCNPAFPPYTGTCTSDSELVAGAHPLRINNFAPNFLSCLTPQCVPDTLYFTLENQDSTCGDACGYLCARGHLWAMTIVGYYLVAEMSATGYPDSQTVINVCEGDTIDFNVEANYGVLPYNYLWTKDGGITYDTTTISQYQLTVTNPSGYLFSCVVKDACGYISIAGTDTIHVISLPITVSGDTLVAPHSDNSYQWYLNGNLLTGDTLQTLIETQLGSYWVAYTDTSNGCGMSTAVVDLTDITALSASGIHVFPNPTSGAWQLTVRNELIGGNVQIYDALGQIVYHSTIHNATTEILPGLANGVYQLRVLNKANQPVYEQSVEKVN